MASIPTQDEILAATRKSQEAMMAAIKNWLDTVRTATPRLPRLPQVSLPFAGKLPTPHDAVANAYDLAEQLLANQRQFAEELVRATAPLWPGHSQSSPEVPSASAWHNAVTDSQPKPAETATVKPVETPVKPVETPVKPVETAVKPVENSAKPVESSAPAPKAAESSTPARTTSRSTAAKRTGTGSTGARKSTAPKGTDAS